MTFSVYFTDLAESGFLSIIDFIAEDNAAKALQFSDDLEQRISHTLSVLPLGGVPYLDFRYISFNNYVVIYDVDTVSQQVTVHMVSERHQDWRIALLTRLDH